MRLLALLPLALAALISAQDTNSTTSIPYSNAATSFLTETDSNGVVTGQPTLPAAVTSQPSAAIVPAGFTSGVTTVTAGNSTYTVSVGNGVTSLVRSTPTPTTQVTAAGSGSGSGSGASASGSSASASSSSGAAAAGHIKAGVGALAAAGGFFAIFL
jgi:hypothetical protein